MIYGCIGQKLGHSFSKEIHERFFGYSYTLQELEPPALAAFLEARDFSGINVTIPYKQAVIPYLDALDDTARAIGAVNTVVNRAGRLIGYNTDFSGLCALLAFAGIELSGRKVLILGSGGTSKTAMAAAKSLGCTEAYRVSRSGRDGAILYEQALQEHGDAQIVINTTPCGMYPNLDRQAICLDSFTKLQGVADAVYNPLRSQLVCRAQGRGIRAIGGLYMLLAQAFYASEQFTGRPVLDTDIEAAYRQLLQKKENIVLIGMPGCGKSTVGRLVAEQLQAEFIDTDELIVQKAGISIPEIFDRSGEQGFRELESAVLHALAARQHCVIATGGGAILRADNLQWLRQNGRLYFIDRPLEQLPVTNDRPLSRDRAGLEQRYRERYDKYCSACDVRIASEASVEETGKKIIEDFTK